MQASELKPGQRFRFIDHSTEYIRVWQHGGNYRVSYLNENNWQVSGCAGDLEVIPLDEPQPTVPRFDNWQVISDPPLDMVIQKGDEYWSLIKNDWHPFSVSVGKTVGVALYVSGESTKIRRPIAAPIAEVPPPTPEPEQFKAGDWVVVTSPSVWKDQLGEIGEIDKYSFLKVVFASGYCWHTHRELRRATAAEIAAYKEAQEPPKRISAISCNHMDHCECVARMWVGKCPHAKEPMPNLQFSVDGFASVVKQSLTTEPQPDADGWIEWSGGEDMPVAQGAKIRVRYADGREQDCEAGSIHSHNWTHDEVVPGALSHWCITHYRLEPSPKPVSADDLEYKFLDSGDMVIVRKEPPQPITDWVEVVTR